MHKGQRSEYSQKKLFYILTKKCFIVQYEASVSLKSELKMSFYNYSEVQKCFIVQFEVKVSCTVSSKIVSLYSLK